MIPTAKINPDLKKTGYVESVDRYKNGDRQE